MPSTATILSPAIMCSRSKFLRRSLSSRVLARPSGSLKNGNGGRLAVLSATLAGSNSTEAAGNVSVAATSPVVPVAATPLLSAGMALASAFAGASAAVSATGGAVASPWQAHRQVAMANNKVNGKWMRMVPSVLASTDTVTAKARRDRPLRADVSRILGRCACAPARATARRARNGHGEHGSWSVTAAVRCPHPAIGRLRWALPCFASMGASRADHLRPQPQQDLRLGLPGAQARRPRHPPRRDLRAARARTAPARPR